MKDKFGKIGWYEEEIEIVKRMFCENKSYEEIAEVVNQWRKERCTTNYFPYRSSRAVIFQANIIGLISDEELKEWDTKNKKDRIKKRNNKKIKEKVLIRDNNECVICKSVENLEFAHIISFYNSKENKEEEAITLCSKHHKIFDGIKSPIKDYVERTNEKIKITKLIFDKMCSYFKKYSDDYEFYLNQSSYCGVHCGIKRIKVKPN